MEPSRLTDRVAAELKRLVVQGEYPPGSRLPSGQDLAATLGVTRLTVREALVQLEAAGFTRTKHGSGTYVSDSLGQATLHLLGQTIAAGRTLSADEIRSLLDFRLVVVSGFVDAIARHVTADQIVRMQALVAEERVELEKIDRLVALDYQLNVMWAEASGNLFYALLLRSLREAHEVLGELVFRHCGDPAAVVQRHAGIVQALADRDGAAVRRRIVSYVEAGNRIVTEWQRGKREARRSR